MLLKRMCRVHLVCYFYVRTTPCLCTFLHYHPYLLSKFLNCFYTCIYGCVRAIPTYRVYRLYDKLRVLHNMYSGLQERLTLLPHPLPPSTRDRLIPPTPNPHTTHKQKSCKKSGAFFKVSELAGLCASEGTSGLTCLGSPSCPQ